MRQKICTMRRWYGGKEKVTIYLDIEEFDQIKKKFQLPQKLNFKMIRWWQDRESLLAFFAVKIINVLLATLLSKKFCGPRLVVGRYSYSDEKIKLFVDKIWLLPWVKNLDAFIDEFCWIAAHEAKHSKDLPDKAAMQIYLASAENTRVFEEVADYFAAEHKNDFKKIFVFEV